MRCFRRALVLASVAAAACGGGTPGGQAPADTPPVVEAPPQQVVFWRQLAEGQRNLYAINEDGTGLVIVADGPGIHSYKAQASSGRLIYETRTGQQVDVWSVGADGTGARALAALPQNERFRALTASDEVIYSSDLPDDAGGVQRDLYRVAADGGGVCAIAATAASEEFLALTADDRVIFRRCLDRACQAADVYAGDCTGAARLSGQSTSGDVAVAGITAAGRVIYTAAGASQDARTIYSVNPDGSGLTALGSTYQGIVLLHGESVVYVEDPRGRIAVVNAAGGTPAILAESPDFKLPRYVTRDGRLIYQQGYSDAPPSVPVDVHSVRLDGSDRRPLAATAYREVYDASADTGRVFYQTYPAFLASPEHFHQLRSANADGSDDRVLASAASAGEFHRFQDMTPSGAVLYVSMATGAAEKYGLQSVNGDGTSPRFLAGHASYAATTVNDRVVYTDCRSLRYSGEAPEWMRCVLAGGDVYVVKTDGTGAAALASGSEEEGFEALLRR